MSNRTFNSKEVGEAQGPPCQGVGFKGGVSKCVEAEHGNGDDHKYGRND